MGSLTGRGSILGRMVPITLGNLRMALSRARGNGRVLRGRSATRTKAIMNMTKSMGSGILTGQAAIPIKGSIRMTSVMALGRWDGQTAAPTMASGIEESSTDMERCFSQMAK